MIYEELKLPLPVYDRIEKQYRYAKGDSINKVIVSRDRIIPFQFIVPSDGTAIVSEWTIRNAEREIIHDLIAAVSALETIDTADGKTYVIYKADDIGLLMNGGIYQMEFVVNDIRYYSEQFDVRCDSPYWNDLQSPFTQIDYNNTCDLGPIMYQTGYINRLYLDTDIHNETPTIEEEGSEDGNGNFIPASQQYIDNLNLEYVSPRYLADAMVLLAMHSDVVLTTPKMVYSGKIRNITPAMTQEDGSWNYRTILTFQQDSKYINGSCCTNIQLAEPPAPPACSAVAQNLVITQNPLGYATAKWEVIGDYNTTRVEWTVDNLTCPESDFAIVLGTTFQIPKRLPSGTLTIKVTPLCREFGFPIVFHNGTPAEASQSVALPIACPPTEPPPPPPPQTSSVEVENNTTDMMITGIVGIPGFSPAAIAPLSGSTGTRTGPCGGIIIHFEEAFAINKRVNIYFDGVFEHCMNLSTSPRSYLFSPTLSGSENIKIVVDTGLC